MLVQAAPIVDAAFVAEVAAREALTDHDVAAFVDVVQAAHRRNRPGKWIHYGLTSSDVVDTALCSTLTAAADLLIAACVGSDRRAQATRARATATRRWPAAPMACTPSRRRSARSSRCGAFRSIVTAPVCVTPATSIAVGKLSGAVGTYSNIDPAVEASVCAALGLAAGAGDAGDQPRSPRRVPVRVRVGRERRSR